MSTSTSNIPVLWPQPGITIQSPSGLVYTLGQPIGLGGFANVFEARDEFGNDLVLKVLRPDGRAFTEVKGQWERERSLSLHLRHPNVVTLLDAFLYQNLFYLVLERAWGPLEMYVRRQGSLGQAEVREVARQLLFGLHFIHQHGVVHRDITISNVLVFEGPPSKGSIFKISDFGISQEVAHWAGTVSGTVTNLAFPPPELLLTQHGYSTCRSDLYHLGLVLLFCAKGTLPLYQGMPPEEVHQVVSQGIPRLEAQALGTELGEFIAVLLRRHSDYRYATALDAWRALRASQPER